MPLVHYMKELEDYKTNHPQGHDGDFIFITNSHIDVLLGFLDQRLGRELRLERDRHLQQPPVATYEFLWLLFRPGDEILLRAPNKEGEDNAESHPYRLAMMEHTSKVANFLIWRIDTMSTQLAPYEELQYVPSFEGEKEISFLKICPPAFLPNYSLAREKFIARGKKFVSLFDPSYMEHSGSILPDYLKTASIEVCLSFSVGSALR
jgi:hypothetical protein